MARTTICATALLALLSGIAVAATSFDPVRHHASDTLLASVCLQLEASECDELSRKEILRLIARETEGK